jgi:hypothetical protein
MPFCYSPWTNIDISPAGALSPCCKYQFSSNQKQFNIKTDSIQDYTSSQLLSSIKQSFNDNQWPDGCQRCQIEEQNNIKSKRQLDQDRWQSHYSNYNLDQNNFITASIAFGNTCNLTCITCNPSSSSKWQKEYNVIYNKSVDPFHFYKQDFVADFVQQSPNIVHLDIPGGEPFLSGVQEQQQLLTYYIESGQSKNISLHYTTNATIYPDDTWWKLWSHFDAVDIQLSIDGVGNRFEYIRYPANWKLVNQNIQQYLLCTAPNLQLSVSHTVSAYNVYYLDEFLSWVAQIGLPTPWLGRVHTPEHMRPTVWPYPAKQFVINKLTQSLHSSVTPWIDLMTNVDDSLHFESFRSYLKKHDQYRGLSFSDTFSELAKFI